MALEDFPKILIQNEDDSERVIASSSCDENVYNTTYKIRNPETVQAIQFTGQNINTIFNFIMTYDTHYPGSVIEVKSVKLSEEGPYPFYYWEGNKLVEGYSDIVWVININSGMNSYPIILKAGQFMIYNRTNESFYTMDMHDFMKIYKKED